MTRNIIAKNLGKVKIDEIYTHNNVNPLKGPDGLNIRGNIYIDDTIGIGTEHTYNSKMRIVGNVSIVGQNENILNIKNSIDENIFVIHDNKIGIKTSNPTNDLHVNGNISCTSLNATISDISDHNINKLSTNITHTKYIDATRTDTYVEDGSITRPYKTIQTALTNFADTHTTVYHLNSGTYTCGISNSDTWNNKVEFIGISRESVILTSGTLTTDCFYLRNKTNGITFKNVTVETAQYGLYIRNSGMVRLINVKFNKCGSSGIEQNHNGSLTQTEQQSVWGGSETSNGGACRIRSCTNVEVLNCYVSYCLRGLRIQDCVGGLITGVRTYKTLESGIYLAAGSYTGADGCSNIYVKNNVVEDAANNGILIVGGVNNTIEDNTIIKSWNSGVQGWSVLNLCINNNRLIGCNNKSFNGIGNTGDACGQIALDGNSNIGSGAYIAHICNNIGTECGLGRLNISNNLYINMGTYPSESNRISNVNNISDCDVKMVNTNSIVLIDLKSDVITDTERTNFSNTYTIVDNATDLNTNNTLVKRDTSGSFNATKVVSDIRVPYKGVQILGTDNNGDIKISSQPLLDVNYGSLISGINNSTNFDELKTALISGLSVKLDLEHVINNLVLNANGSTFLGIKFYLTFNMMSIYTAVANVWSLKDFSVIKAGIEVQTGVPVGTYTEAQAIAIYKSSLESVYSDVDFNNLYECRLPYNDPENYELEILDNVSDKIYFMGNLVNSPGGISTIDWRLNYCTGVGNSSSRYSTILFGSKNNKTLTILPNINGESIEFPVSGSGGVQIGYPLSMLTILNIK